MAKWLHGEVEAAPKYRRSEQPNKLTVFHEAIKQALKVDSRRPKRERRTAKALYVEIKTAGKNPMAAQLACIELEKQLTFMALTG